MRPRLVNTHGEAGGIGSDGLRYGSELARKESMANSLDECSIESRGAVAQGVECQWTIFCAALPCEDPIRNPYQRWIVHSGSGSDQGLDHGRPKRP